jgi:hypothetical protein
MNVIVDRSIISILAVMDERSVQFESRISYLKVDIKVPPHGWAQRLIACKQCWLVTRFFNLILFRQVLFISVHDLQLGRQFKHAFFKKT